MNPGPSGPPPVGQIALAVMAKVPEAGHVKTRLCPPLAPAEAALLARCFLLDRVDQLRDIPGGEPIVAFTPRHREGELRPLLPTGVRLVPQGPGDLGARLDRLLTDLLAEGYVGAVAIDADSPTLPSAYLEQACVALRDDAVDVVVGPCEDGGYYLIGLRRPAPGLFLRMPWSTPAVTEETATRASRAGLRLTLLPAWFDVDRGEDLARLRATAAHGGAFRPPRTLALLRAWEA